MPQEQSIETKGSTEDQIGEEELLVTPGMNWFVLRVASNKEDHVRQTLVRKIKIEGFEHLVNRILVPTEKQKTIKGGKQKIVERKLYPGYVFVEMKLEDDGRIPQDGFGVVLAADDGDAGKPGGQGAPDIGLQQVGVDQGVPAPADVPDERPEAKRRGTAAEFQTGDLTGDGGEFGQ